SAAVQLGMALLASETLDLGDGDAVDAHFRKRLAHVVELERLDDGGDQFHGGDLTGGKCQSASIGAAVVERQEWSPCFAGVIPDAVKRRSGLACRKIRLSPRR